MGLITDFSGWSYEATKITKGPCERRYSIKEGSVKMFHGAARLFFRAKKLSSAHSIGSKPNPTLVKQAPLVAVLIGLIARSRYFNSHRSALTVRSLCESICILLRLSGFLKVQPHSQLGPEIFGQWLSFYDSCVACHHTGFEIILEQKWSVDFEVQLKPWNRNIWFSM